ncbi:MAG: galactose-1-phosphate uridylyltransferase [Candidatus Omnitrophota bacterium]
MAELRKDPIVGRWVVVNTKDSWGPQDFDKEEHHYKQEAICQFCYGREHQTPSEIEAVRPHNTKADTQGWMVRVIPNKFPVLRIEGELKRSGLGIFDTMNGIGAHEIIIETPNHRKSLADLTNEEILSVVKKYQSRSKSLAEDKRFKYILIFKNFGDSAGASLEHGHTQLIALPMVPKYVLEELEGSKYYYEYRGRCIFCDMINQEYQDKERIVAENKDFICFCPYVPRYPFETWIIPKKHSAPFNSITEEEQYHLSCSLGEVLRRMKVALNNPSYNFFLHTAPVGYENNESYHWHIEIIPKLTRVAGFEWGTGFYLVPTSPDLAAKYLREVNLETKS